LKDKVILLVEDNADDELLTLRELQKNNIANEIVVARDGEQALERLFGATVLPQTVLLDLNLPKIDGLELLQRIRTNSRTRSLPVVILTASNADKDRIKAYDLGVNGYVRKPVRFGDFGVATRELGLYWLLLNQSPFRGQHWQPIV
jgi:two-component system, response regulator